MPVAHLRWVRPHCQGRPKRPAPLEIGTSGVGAQSHSEKKRWSSSVEREQGVCNRFACVIDHATKANGTYGIQKIPPLEGIT